MFCHQEDKDASLSCELKWVYEIISFVSLICSIFVVYVTVKKIKMNIIHKLIVQIIVSEIIDEINILLSIISDSRIMISECIYVLHKYIYQFFHVYGL